MALTSKNLVRLGALLVLVGFFMPTVLVSCTALGSTTPIGEMSLADLAGGSQGRAGESSLYLVFFGMLVTLGATFMAFIRQDLDRYMPMLEAGAVAISLLVIVTKLLQLKGQADNLGLTFELRYGAFFLFVGFLLAIGGVSMGFANGLSLNAPQQRAGQAFYPSNQPYSPPDQEYYPQVLPPQNQVAAARLELVSGNLSMSMVPVTGTDFSIGRGSANDLNIPDKSISRSHVRLRYAQGSWFLQDQDSALGTYVNGQRVQAGRLNPGDQLKIGNAVFIFRC